VNVAWVKLIEPTRSALRTRHHCSASDGSQRICNHASIATLDQLTTTTGSSYTAAAPGSTFTLMLPAIIDLRRMQGRHALRP
jgi:hypothetical protein